MENNDIQKLLKMTFKAERKYFEAGERVQVVDFSRFLHYQSTKRNHFCNKLIESFVENEVEPDMTYINKGRNKISGLEIKRLLEDTKYVSQVKKCLKFDTKLIDICNEVLKDTSIPVGILEVITKEMTYLTLAQLEGEKLLKNYKENKSELQPKIISLQQRKIINL